MEVRPIRTIEDHAEALGEIDRLWGADPGSPEGERLDVLLALVEQYEDRHLEIPRADPLGVLRFMMEQNGKTQSDLAALFGSRSRASEVLNGRRNLTLDQIRLLATHWRIPAGALIGLLETA